MNQKLKQQRQGLGFTLEEMANKVGVAKSTILKWENGDIKSIKSDKINAYAKALNVPPSFIIGEDKPSNSNQAVDITFEDTRDIERKLEILLNDASEQGHFAAYGGKSPSEMSEEEYEDHILFKNALRETLRIAKRINKEKHTPNKYREGDN